MLGFGIFGGIWVGIGPKEDEALRIGQGGDGQTNEQIPPVLYRTSSPSGTLPKKPFVLISVRSRYNIHCPLTSLILRLSELRLLVFSLLSCIFIIKRHLILFITESQNVCL